MNITSIIMGGFLFVQAVHGMQDPNENTDIKIEEDHELGGYRVDLLTPDMIQKYSFLKKQTLPEWVETVKENKMVEPVEKHLTDLIWTYFSIVENLEQNQFDNAYRAFKQVTILRNQASEIKNGTLFDILNDAWTQHFELEKQPFLKQFKRKKLIVLEEHIIEDPSMLSKEQEEKLTREAWNNCTDELIQESEMRFAKIVLVGAALDACKPAEWLYKVQMQAIEQQKIQKKPKENSSCILN
jgi:hypothetical protein